ncbi:hypothetical protein Tco_0394522 [Tanacetum coccineum]
MIRLSKLLTQHAASESESRVPGAVSECESLAVYCVWCAWRHPPPPSILSHESHPIPYKSNQPAASPYRLAVIYETYYPEHPLVEHTSPVYPAHGAQQALRP